jgi:putative Holliday junction resolvase
MTARGAVLGIDYGSRRIGLAVSDPDRIFAFPAGFLLRQDKERDLASLRRLAEEREVVQIVVGLPIHMNGREGPEARAARAFAEDLRQETGRSVDLLDERWTSREAERALRDAQPPGKRSAQRGAAERSSSGKRSAQRGAAERSSSGRGREASRRRAEPGDVDAAAAALILRTWLAREAHRGEGER